MWLSIAWSSVPGASTGEWARRKLNCFLWPGFGVRWYHSVLLYWGAVTKPHPTSRDGDSHSPLDGECPGSGKARGMRNIMWPFFFGTQSSTTSSLHSLGCQAWAAWPSAALPSPALWSGGDTPLAFGPGWCGSLYQLQWREIGWCDWLILGQGPTTVVLTVA